MLARRRQRADLRMEYSFPGGTVYQSCIFCAAPLGANEAITSFPVGRQLAFDSWKGRL
jgi:hypothetical protein